MRILTKDEFKDALKDAKIKEEVETLMAEEKRRPGRPKKIEIKDKSRSAKAKPIEEKKEIKKKAEPKKAEPKAKPKKESAVAAARKFTAKEREALQCLAQIAENRTSEVLDKAGALKEQADKLTNISILYREYIDIVKEMAK